jgi:pimeloyl-ACP methyl ester carboxylesterase
MGAGAAPVVDEELRRLAVPCLFVAGADDAPYVAAAEELAALVPQGRVQVLAETGHNVPAERPAELARVLEAHLSTR